MQKLVTRLVLLALFALFIVPAAAFAQDTIAPTDGGSIDLGDSVEGELTLDEPAFAYTLVIEAETFVELRLTSDDFDCYLTLLDEDGDEIAFDDDGAGNLDSSISTSLDAGTYTVVAQSYSYRNGQPTALGDFTLSAQERRVNAIEYGESVNGELSGSQLSVTYNFAGEAGDVIIAEHFSDDYDSYLTLELNGSELAFNDDGAGNLDSRIGPFTLPQDGTYTLVVTSLSRSDTGSFEVQLQRVELSEISFGEPVTVELIDAAQPLFFTFAANAGDVISVTVESDADTNLAINDPGNFQVFSDEDSGSGTNPEASAVALNSSGIHTLVIRSSNGETGEVTITVERATLPTLDDGPVTVSFNSNTVTRTLVFNAEDNTTYRLTMELTQGVEGSPALDITQEGMSVTYTSANQVRFLSIEFTTDVDGEVVVRLSDYSYDNRVYTVTLDEVE
ncbi:MAG: DVUA0089 family protein [bacterium]|nr:DVUA0089 family protein [bacterium]